MRDAACAAAAARKASEAAATGSGLGSRGGGCEWVGVRDISMHVSVMISFAKMHPGNVRPVSLNSWQRTRHSSLAFLHQIDEYP